jgi:hypothetical protein
MHSLICNFWIFGFLDLGSRLTHPETATRQEGFHAFYKGITPRIMRVAPGQAVTFTVYEFLKEKLENSTMPIVGGKYEE